MKFLLHDFTGFERTFEYSIEIDGKWHEFKCYADYHVVYDLSEEKHELILDKVQVIKYSKEYEKYFPYTLSKDEFTTLQQNMNDYAHWEDLVDWYENLHNHD